MKRRNLPLILCFVGIVVAGHAVAGYFFFRQADQSLLFPPESLSSLGNEGYKLAARVQKEPCNRTLVNSLALHLLKSHEYSKVLSLFQYYQGKCGENNDLLPSVYSAQMGLSKFLDAETTASHIIAEYPADPSAYGWRAQAMERNGKFQNAYEDMQKALSLFPDPARVSGQVYYDTARLAAKAGFPCDALNLLRDFVAFDAGKRRTQQIDTLMREWQKQGLCPSPFGKGSALVRYSTQEAAIVVPVEINGIRASMILDTGASVTLVSKEFSKRAAIDTSKRPSEVALTASGATLINVGRADTMSIGDASLKNVLVSVPSNSSSYFGDGVDGLLGLSFLGNFQIKINNGVLELKQLD